MNIFKITTITAALVLSAGANAATIIATDNTWSVTTADQGTNGWNTDIIFDVAPWEAATIVQDYDGIGLVADAIWSSDGSTSGPIGNEIWARRAFSLNQIPTIAIMTGAFDDDGSLYVNGNLVVNSNNGAADAFGGGLGIDISSYLVTGDNLIAFNAYDVQASNREAWVQVDAQFSAVPVPAAVWLFGSGLLGLVGIARRKKA